THTKRSFTPSDSSFTVRDSPHSLSAPADLAWEWSLLGVTKPVTPQLSLRPVRRSAGGLSSFSAPRSRRTPGLRRSSERFDLWLQGAQDLTRIEAMNGRWWMAIIGERPQLCPGPGAKLLQEWRAQVYGLKASGGKFPRQ